MLVAIVVAETTADVILRDDLKNSSSLATAWKAYWDYSQLESRVLLLHIAGSWFHVGHLIQSIWAYMWTTPAQVTPQPIASSVYSSGERRNT